VWNLSFKKMSVADIMEAVPVSVERVCLTGGEPCAHKLSELVGVLHTMLHKVHVESNGTLHPDWLDWVDHLVVSPKREKEVPVSVLRKAAELKFIVDETFKIEEALRYARDFVGPVYLSPVNFQTNLDKVSVKRAVAMVLKHPQFRLTMQLHKILDIK